jgi:hypothetical protein
MAKPLISSILVKNTNKTVSTPNINDTTRKKRIKLITPIPLIVEKVVLSIPRGSRELHTIVSIYNHGSYSATTQRLLFRKVEKGYNKID